MLAELFYSTSEDKKKSVEKLIEHSTPSYDFFLMIVLSVTMASFGLLLDSPAIVIGAMLVAPVLYPVLSAGMGVVMFNSQLMRRSFFTLGRAVLLALAASFLVGLFFASSDSLTSTELISRTAPSLLNVAVAVIAGFAGAFALVKPRLSETIPGIAISVALVPPLAASGIGLSLLSGAVIKGALLLFLINVLAVLFASIFVFSLMNFYIKRRTAEKAIEKEDEKQEEIKEKAEEEVKRG